MICQKCKHPAGNRYKDLGYYEDGRYAGAIPRSYHLKDGHYQNKCPICGCTMCVAVLEQEQ